MKFKRFTLAVVAIAGVGVAVWLGRDVYANASIGTAYVAKQTCSCLFVARRSMQSCKTDYNAADVEPLEWKTMPDRVQVSALAGLISATALFEAGYGCHLID